MKRSRIAMAAMLATAWLSGCGGGGPSIIAVTGKVTLGGKPLEGLSMAFVPEPSNPDQTTGAATTDASGEYRAMSDGGPGLAAGKYRVGITRYQGTIDAAPKPSTRPELANDDYQAFLASGGGLPGSRPAGGGKAAKAASKLPQEVQFVIEVTPEKRAFDFDVEKGTGPGGAAKDPSKR